MKIHDVLIGSLLRIIHRRDHRLLLVEPAVCLLALGLLLFSANAAAQTSTPEPPSAIGNQFVTWIAVSPAYERTGFVLAVATDIRNCSKDCTHLWVSRNGGANWKRAQAAGWEGGQPIIAVDDKGVEALFSPGTSGLKRSNDAGETWNSVGPSGIPTPMPSYSRDGAVAVAGGKDYVLRGSALQEIRGSGGAVVDMGFAFAPMFPDEGSYPPALLVGADKSNGHPIIQACTPELSCSGTTRLVGPTEFAIPVTLHLSSAYAVDGVVFAQSRRGIHKSTDGGRTFTPLPVADPAASDSATPMLALAPGYKEAGPVRTVYIALLQIYQPKVASIDDLPRAWGGVYRSTDGGLKWSRIGSPSPLDGGASALGLAHDGRLFAGYMPGTVGQAGLLCSVNGKTWKASCPAIGESADGESAGAGKSSGDASSENEGRVGSTTDDGRFGDFFEEVPRRIAATARAATKFPWSIVVLAILGGGVAAALAVVRRRRRSLKSR